MPAAADSAPEAPERGRRAAPGRRSCCRRSTRMRWCGSAPRTFRHDASSSSMRATNAVGSLPSMVHVEEARRLPPRAGASSRRITRAPERAAVSAAISPAGPAPRDEHVAEGVAAIVVIGVGLVRGPPESRRLADEVLVEHPPRAGPHERLVVEPGREQLRGGVAERSHVEFERRPAVLAGGGESVVELDPGRLQVRLGPGSCADAHEGIGFFRSGSEDPAPAVILEAAPDEPHAVRQQRRGERVAPVPPRSARRRR